MAPEQLPDDDGRQFFRTDGHGAGCEDRISPPGVVLLPRQDDPLGFGT